MIIWFSEVNLFLHFMFILQLHSSWTKLGWSHSFHPLRFDPDDKGSSPSVQAPYKASGMTSWNSISTLIYIGSERHWLFAGLRSLFLLVSTILLVSRRQTDLTGHESYTVTVFVVVQFLVKKEANCLFKQNPVSSRQLLEKYTSSKGADRCTQMEACLFLLRMPWLLLPSVRAEQLPSSFPF